MPFDHRWSAPYSALTADKFRRGLLGDPKRQTKKSVLLHVTDLYLYPLVKVGYDRGYLPFHDLFNQGRVIDALVPEDDRPLCGIKHSCFAGAQKGEGPTNRPNFLIFGSQKKRTLSLTHVYQLATIEAFCNPEQPTRD